MPSKAKSSEVRTQACFSCGVHAQMLATASADYLYLSCVSFVRQARSLHAELLSDFIAATAFALAAGLSAGSCGMTLPRNH